MFCFISLLLRILFYIYLWFCPCFIVSVQYVVVYSIQFLGSYFVILFMHRFYLNIAFLILICLSSHEFFSYCLVKVLI